MIIFRDSYKMLLWLDSPSQFGDARFVINTECLNLLPIAGFPPPAEYYDSALKTPSASSVLHRVPPTAEIIQKKGFPNLFNPFASGALKILAKDPSPWLLSASSAAADLHEHPYIRAAEGTCNSAYHRMQRIRRTH